MFHTKVKLKNLAIVIICITAIITGVALTPYQASAEAVTSITVDQTKTTSQYRVGSTIQPEDIYIYVNGSLDSTQCSTLPDATVDVPENTAVGSKTVTLHYAGMTAVYQVVVLPTTPSVIDLRKLDFDTVRAYGSTMSGVDGYNFRCKLIDSTTTILMGVTSNKTVYDHYYDTVEYLKPGKTYSFTVRAYKDVDGKRYFSSWSTAKSITMPTLYGADKWRPEIKRQLEAHGVYSKYRENIIVNIIDNESGGSQYAGQGNYYVGLLQFGAQWKHDYSTTYFSNHVISNYHSDNRLSGSWSIHRVAQMIKEGGTSVLKQYWGSTWNQ